MKISEKWKSAIENQDVNQVKSLIQQTPDLVKEPITIIRRNGTSYQTSNLMFANQSLPIVKILVEAGVDVNVRAPAAGGLAIHDASLEVAEYLIEQGMDINAVGSDDYQPLLYAAYMGDAPVVKLLLQKGADPLVEHPTEKLSALHCACFYYPLMKGYKSAEGFDPNPFIEIVKLLLNTSCDVNKPCANNTPTSCGPMTLYGETPLHFAKAGKNKTIVKMLLEAGADPNVKNSLGETPEDWAKKYKR